MKTTTKRKKMKSVALAVILSAWGIAAFAQGNNVGMGNERDSMQSLSERVLKLEKKTDAFNVYLNMHTSYQERFNGEDEGGSFVGRQLRLEMVGDLTDRWGYRLRYRMNRPGEQQSDNFSNNIDIMMVRYKVNDRLALYGGKLGVALGGYQYDANPIQVLEFCDYLSGIDGFHVGVHASYQFAKDNYAILGVYNANNNSADKYFSEDPSVKAAKHPLGVVANWTGSLFDGKVRTTWGYALVNDAKGAYTNIVSLGTMVNLSKWQFIVDYYGGWSDLDRFKTVSADISQLMNKTVLMRKTCYNTLLGEVHYKPTPHWDCLVYGSMEFASASDSPHFRNYRRSYGYHAAVQWIPDLTQDARISLAYIGKKVDYKSGYGLDDYNRDRIELSLIYRIKAF